MDPVSFAVSEASVRKLAYRIPANLSRIQPLAKDASACGPLGRGNEYTRLKLLISLQNLSRWERGWSLDDDSLDEGDKLHSVWGDQGWIVIQRQLAVIDKQCQDLYNLMQTSQTANVSASKKGHTALRWAVRQQKKTQASLKAWQSGVDSLGKDVDTLCQVSDAYFCANHISAGSLNETQLSDPVELIEDTQTATNACYRFSMSRHADLYVDLGSDGPHSFRRNRRSQTNRCFRYLAGDLDDGTAKQLTDPSEQQCTRNNSASQQSIERSSAMGLWIQSTSNDELLRSTICRCDVPEHDPPKSASSEILSGMPELTLYDELILVGVGGDAGPEKLKDKFLLALKAAYFCMLTLGTPWMSHLKSRNITNTSTGDGSLRQLVHVSRQDGLTRNGSSKPVSSRQQIVQFGIFLAEVALDKQYSSSDLAAIQTCRTDMPLIIRRMGLSYGAICEECLSSHNSATSMLRPQSDDPDHARPEGVNDLANSSHPKRDRLLNITSGVAHEAWENEVSNAEHHRQLRRFNDRVFLRLKSLRV